MAVDVESCREKMGGNFGDRVMPPFYKLVNDTSLFNYGDTNTIKVFVRNDVNGPHGFNLKVNWRDCQSTPLGVTPSSPRPNPLQFAVAYPNPSSGSIRIENLPPHLKVNFTLTDLTGQILLQSTRPELDISGLPTGMYLLRMRAGRAQFSIRVLKQ